MIKALIVTTSILLLLLFSPVKCIGAGKKATLGVLPFYSYEKLVIFYNPFVDYLTKTTGINWEFVYYSTYDELIVNLCKGEIDIAFLGSLPFARAHKACNIKPLLTVLNERGKPSFRAVIFTASRAINSLDDLRGKRFGFGSRTSTAAYVIPRKMFEDAGIHLQDIEPVYFRNHEDIIKAVLTGKIDAGAIREPLLEQYKNPFIRVIATYEEIPNLVFVTSPKTRKTIQDRFIKSLSSLRPRSSISDKEIVSNWDPELRHGFVKVTKDYIDATNQLLELYHRYNP